ncbi:MAG: NAD(P)/FAD-dependent oxidoreductase [Ottowia sp.]|nr:NAD(P)/FAD-dependent oxidoreductase [Ottowia sp.]
MTEKMDCVVIGAGVVGLAVARACARSGLQTLVLEAANAVGTGISSRNSEVIHAGIYYRQGSLKARCCVRGRKLLYDYCRSRGIAFRRCGKLIVVTRKEQQAALRALHAKAVANGVHDLKWLDGAAARDKEPALRCAAALWSPSTGIVDSHALMLALWADLEAAGGMVALCSPVVGGQVAPSAAGVVLRVGSTGPMELLARHVVNAAGLQAVEVAHMIRGLAPTSIPKYHFAKGNYFAFSGHAPFSHLIYPVPEAGGLGVHLTLDLNGRARFGPDVEWVDRVDYTVDPQRGARFHEVIRRYWPALPDNSLHPDYSGIRPKLVPPGAPDADFLIQDQRAHRVTGLIHLYGIESPGLTAALALADRVCDLLQASKS